MKKFWLPIVLTTGLLACQKQEQADLLVTNAVIYTVDSSFTIAEAMAISNGKVLATGPASELIDKYTADTVIDLGGLAVYPGFHDPHAHFYRYSLGLQDADLTGATSEEEMLERVSMHAQKYPGKKWITGRGWDQNLWKEKAFPDRSELDALFPEIPVLLTRVDGHAALVNERALALAGIDGNTKVSGGKIVTDDSGRATGVLIDNAIDLVSMHIPEPQTKLVTQALQEGEKNCFAVGLTSVSDAGLDHSQISLINLLQKSGQLNIRMYVMVNPNAENVEEYLKKGPLATERLTVSSMKVYADGALGSRGACLLSDYTDDAGNRGFLLSSPEKLDSLARLCYEAGFQMNTHCIGDSANRLMLDIYARYLQGKNDRRWRIEHAQVVHPVDVPKYGKYNVLPSVQPTHATSDMYWADERLGKERIKTAYAFKDLMKQNNMIPLGSDFPVEAINPLYGFYSATARKDAEGNPTDGFQKENALTREEALRGMTIWAAYANFEDSVKGSLEPGKWADFVVLERDIMNAPEQEIRQTAVHSTWLAGEPVYRAAGE